jgi:uncharacterized protein YbjT (DUF2867 family)
MELRMRVTIFGSTGLIGRAVTKSPRRQGIDVLRLVHQPANPSGIPAGLSSGGGTAKIMLAVR